MMVSRFRLPSRVKVHCFLILTAALAVCSATVTAAEISARQICDALLDNAWRAQSLYQHQPVSLRALFESASEDAHPAPAQHLVLASRVNLAHRREHQPAIHVVRLLAEPAGIAASHADGFVESLSRQEGFSAPLITAQTNGVNQRSGLSVERLSRYQPVQVSGIVSELSPLAGSNACHITLKDAVFEPVLMSR